MGGKGKQTIGYHYIFTKHAGLCRGPINSLVEIRADDKVALTGEFDGSEVLKINKPNLFGGEQKEGGIQGAARLFMGAPDQVLPGAETVSSIGGIGPVKKTVLPDLKAAYGGLVSEMRGFVSFWYDGLVTSMSPYPKPWKFRLRRSTAGWHNNTPWYPAKAIIYMADSAIHAMNPAHIIYQCLTDPQWGKGEPTSMIDTNSFIYAANTLCSEGFGLCFNWSRQEDVDVFIQVVIDHIGGATYIDPETGKWVLRLIRADYDPDDVPLYDASSGLLAIEDDDSASSEDAVNELVVTGHDPLTDEDFEVRDHNISAWQAQQQAISASVEYKGIPTRDLALRVAQRDLRTHASGLKRLRLQFDRRAWRITPASVIRIASPNHDIANMVLRVGEIDYGSIAKGVIKVKVVEDVFGMPETSFSSPVVGGWTPPAQEAAPSPGTLLISAPYRNMLLRLGDSDMKDIEVTDAFIGQLARSPDPASYSYDIASMAAGDSDYTIYHGGHFTGHAVTVADILPLDTEVELTNLQDVNEDMIGEVILIGEEMVEIADFDPLTSIATILRGACDTIPQPHAAGTSVWTIDDDLISDERAYADGETVSTKVLSRTASDVLTLDEATADTITLVARHALPYPPGDVQVDGDSIFAMSGVYPEPALTWAHRDRILQADQIVTHLDGSVGPEAGTTYTIRVRDTEAGLPIRTVTGITGDNWTYDSTMQATDGNPTVVWMELESVRDGLTSHQTYDFRVTISGGWGYAWGFNYGGDT